MFPSAGRGGQYKNYRTHLCPCATVQFSRAMPQRGSCIIYFQFFIPTYLLDSALHGQVPRASSITSLKYKDSTKVVKRGGRTSCWLGKRRCQHRARQLGASTSGPVSEGTGGTFGTIGSDRLHCKRFTGYPASPLTERLSLVPMLIRPGRTAGALYRSCCLHSASQLSLRLRSVISRAGRICCEFC